MQRICREPAGSLDRPTRAHHQRGSAMLIAMIALTALVSLAGLTALSVQGSIASTGQSRFQSIALYAAESGASAAMDYLRKTLNTSTDSLGVGGWDSLVTPKNQSPITPAEIPGNTKAPGVAGNLFSTGIEAWYEVTILNNPSDSYVAGSDGDKILIIHAVGHGPDGAMAAIEWTISGDSAQGQGRPCPTYGQKGMAEDGAGRNDCLSTITSTNVATYRPGGS